MRGLCKVSLAVGLVVFVASPALAQGGRGGFGGMGAGLLATNKSVQEELKMDKEQVDKAAEALKKFNEDNKDDLAKLRRDSNASQEDRAAVMKKVNEGGQKIAADVLKPEQLKRFKQIQLQQEGPAAFANADTQKALNLMDKQKEELKTIAEDYTKQARELRPTGGNFQEVAEKRMALRKDKLDAALKVLTDDQKKTYKELTGAPFEIKIERRRQQQ
jgi:hypothetical protein